MYSLDTASNSQGQTSFNFNVFFFVVLESGQMFINFLFFMSSLYYYNFFVKILVLFDNLV